MSRCEICGTQLKDDLFASVTQEPVCAICKLKYIGGLPTSPARVAQARSSLGLASGVYLIQNNPQEAARILGRD